MPTRTGIESDPDFDPDPDPDPDSDNDRTDRRLLPGGHAWWNMPFRTASGYHSTSGLGNCCSPSLLFESSS
ncbi:MAG: hypothetical protein ACOX52_24030 [Verrucomicrobiota bacterium]